jgi:hypothetical protein
MSRALFGLKTLATYAKTYGRLIVPHEIAVDIIAKLPELGGTLKKRAAPAVLRIRRGLWASICC